MTPPFPSPSLFFVAFCRILPTNVVICRLQSIAHYTLRSAKRVQGGFPLTPFTKCALILNLRLSVRPAELFPHWLSPPPPGAVQTLWNNMSVGACFLPRKKITVKGASHGFATLPLTVIFLCGFTETPTEQNVQRACSRHEPTQGF